MSLLRALLLISVVAGSLLAQSDTLAETLLSEAGNSPSLERNLRTLCDEIGGRLAGTSAYDRAAEWALEAFRAAGVDKAHAEQFEMPVSWREGDTQIEVLAPTKFRVSALSTAWSPATRRRGVEAEVLDAGRGSPGRIVRLGSKARGKILLVRLAEASAFYDLGVEQRNAIVAMREAEQVGAAAVLYASTRPLRLLYRHIHSITGELDPVPSALITREDALRIARFLDDGAEVKINVRLPNRIGGPFKQSNVVAEIRGSEQPDEIVIFGAHLDSWDLGSGCLDNGCNVSIVIETARAIVATGLRPRRTLRFVLFGGEEQGVHGSRSYVRAHRDELDKIVAVMVHDMGLGEIRGYSLGGRYDMEEGVLRAVAPLGGRADEPSFEAFYGTDHYDFFLEGIPTLVAMQDTTEYVAPYHSPADTYDKISLYALRRRAQVAAVVAFNLANDPKRLGPRYNREQIEGLLESTRMKDQLEFLNLWDEWASGERGRAAE